VKAELKFVTELNPVLIKIYIKAPVGYSPKYMNKRNICGMYILQQVEYVGTFRCAK